MNNIKKFLNKKTILSLTTLAAAGLMVFGITKAFFSDTETSTDNTFQAGALDLKIDNTSYWNRGEGGRIEKREDLSWGLADLDDGNGPSQGQYLFFNFEDMKPGDLGEDTISLHTDNDAWVCADMQLTANDDVTCTEPEYADDPSCTSPGEEQGELAEQLNFVFWWDDGDNVLEEDEVGQVLAQGSASQLLNGTWPIADATTQTGPIPGGEESTTYIGKAWCFGNLTLDPAAEGDGTPEDRQETGVKCDGEPVNNAAQTDNLMGDITFRAVQARHNEGYTCSGGEVTPTPSVAITEVPQPTPTPQLACTNADVMLVLDRSGSIGSTNMATLRNAANSFVDDLSLSTDGNHAGEVSFSTDAVLDQELTDNATLVHNAIDALLSSGRTNLVDAITLADGELGGGNDRPDGTSPDFMLIITDGQPNEPNAGTAEADAATAAATAKANGVQIYVVGIGGSVNSTYLHDDISNGDGYYFGIGDYSDLTTVLQGLATCEQ